METQPTQAEQTAGSSRRYRAAGYIGFLLLSYAIFLIVTFPYDLLAKGIMSRTQSSLPFPVNFESISPRFPLGVKLTGIELGSTSPADLQVVQIDSLNIKASLSKALRKQIDTTAEALMDGGKVIVEYDGNDIAGDAEFRIVSTEFNRILALLSKIPSMVALSRLPWGISGKVGGKGIFHFDRLKIRENTGELKLVSQNLGLSDVDLIIKKVDFEFSKAEGNFELSKGGILNISSLNLEGKPCGFDITGKITINYAAFLDSRLDLEIVLHPSPEFEEKIPLDLLKKNNKGLHIGNLRGTFNKPKFP